ncbi:cyclic nucleotide-binding protein [Magnetococcus marinus MC-1]|uniref:Cyclic nucleotide-binding protein n=1 Tax=Magnetococcus marinus (strain ATCC BAA-1437 / JCM 17883 / MC-1) TaxID=156889 RepID=A0L6N5_MAGMM|nr:SulP family inorganic anion transporter [Magnetococcus marinus]ABK43628.1 cyclic nucleotide-binding protein [Magnetococcus marinus MC-1]
MFVKQWSKNLVVGFFIGLLNITYGISLAALIFPNQLEQFMPTAIGMVLVAFLVGGIVVALGSALKGVIAAPQSNTAAILPLMTGAIAATLYSRGLDEQVLPTVIAAILITTLLSGLSLLIMGHYGLGKVIRNIPHPVMGGFMASTGWLLLQGGFVVMTGHPLSFTFLPNMLAPEILTLWAPGLAFALLLLLSELYSRHFLVIPALMVSLIALVHGVLYFADISMTEAMTIGWLLEVREPDILWPPVSLHDFSLVNWGLLTTEIYPILTILVIGSISLLFNVSSLELVAPKAELDLNRELKAASFASLAGFAVGGLASAHQPPYTFLAWRLGAASKWTGVIAALTCGMVFFVDARNLSYLPIALLGGMPVYIGIILLREWLWRSWGRLPISDYLLVLVITVAVAFAGFLAGVAVGLVMAIFLFVINYSHVDVVKYEISGKHYCSNVERGKARRDFLRQHGHAIHILTLNGFLFFGSSQKLLDRINAHVEVHNNQTQFLILDFAHVNHIDTSGALGLKNFISQAKATGITMIYTGLNDNHVSLFIKMGLVDKNFNEENGRFNALDQGVAWCEEQLLKEYDGSTYEPTDWTALLTRIMGSTEMATRILPYLKELSLKSGDILFEQGEVTDGLYIIESGKIAIYFSHPDGWTKQVRILEQGTLVGEMGLYHTLPRSAAAIVEESGIVHHFSHANYQRLLKEDPLVAAHLSAAISRLLTERILFDEARYRVMFS